MSAGTRGTVQDGVRAGIVAGLIGSLPSTTHAVATGVDPLAAATAAGSLLLPRERRTVPLVLASVPVHMGISIAWGVVLTALLPTRARVLSGALSGLVIAAVDLGVIGRRRPRIRALPLLPQLADHIVFGATVGGLLDRRRVRGERE
jgi:hypothetical protein